MTNANLKIVVAVCAIALTIMAGLYLFTSTPLCEVFSTERTVTEQQQQPWYSEGDPPTRTTVYIDVYSEPAGQCIEVVKR